MAFVIIIVVLLFVISYTYFSQQGNYWWKKITKAALISVGIILLYALYYKWSMGVFEGVEKTYIQSIQVVVESITTAGYGGDSPWQSVEMNAFVLFMNFTGVIMVFFAVPLFVVPMIERAFQRNAPTSVKLSGHVIICSKTSRASILKDELSSKFMEYVIVDENQENVMQLHKQGVNVVYGNALTESVLNQVCIDEALAIVCDLEDEKNALLALTAKKMRPELQIITIADSSKTMKYHKFAGATDVIMPRSVLGSSLADKALVQMHNELQGITRLSDNMEVAELIVEPGSPMQTFSFGESGLLDSRHPLLIGIWEDGQFLANPRRDARIKEHTILLLSGSHEELLELRKRTSSGLSGPSGNIILAGYGAVGRAVSNRFQQKDVPHTIVELNDDNEADVIGDICEEDVLKEAGIEQAPCIILALNSDARVIYASLVIKNIAPQVKIIARVNQVENIENVYRAGADYVLSLSVVSGRMVYSTLADSDLVLSSDTTYEVVRTKATKLAGITLDVEQVRQNSGATIVAVERQDDMLFNLDDGIELKRSDTIIIAGSDASVNTFRKMYC
jgi:Trk K+ transport system NAD-binding subunit